MIGPSHASPGREPSAPAASNGASDVSLDDELLLDDQADDETFGGSEFVGLGASDHRGAFGDFGG